MINLKISLCDLIGTEYCDAMGEVSSFISGLSYDEVMNIVQSKIEFIDKPFIDKQEYLKNHIGEKLFKGLDTDNSGAPTDSFKHAFKKNMTPLGGIGAFRIGEDGKVYLAAKSEHYHVPLGHNFPGYRLMQVARELGIPNATHNNTRGYITRTLEKELIRTVNGISKSYQNSLQEILDSKERRVLNRVINLETGSLAVEAGVKMMLARFYRLDKTYGEPKYSSKLPVFFVMSDNNGGFEANYHGTTMITQTFRGMWPELYKSFEKNEQYKVVSVRINDIADFKNKIKIYNSGNYKTAGFLHEIILMNYGGIRLTQDYLSAAYKMCHETDTFILCDEIQSCMWYRGMFLHRHYGLDPDFVILGKGFPGGEYPASRILTTYEADCLNQFGALVTNGQEELASLAYLITMEFAQANGDFIEESGRYLQTQLNRLREQYSDVITKIEGLGHLSSIHFKSVDDTVNFVKVMNSMCVDISAQTYKANCPPAALLKPPIITDSSLIDIIIEKMKTALNSL
ncbi:MAG: aminotransferase class III-fold pyridoxal phosphate-dependent enzyme [Clostridiales bacterium]|nr:aminotransferase class III-fold pyridoxal phosphate-dependent enzyme [Clostridiales bacterium]